MHRSHQYHNFGPITKMIFSSKLLVEGPIAQIWCWKLLSTVFFFNCDLILGRKWDICPKRVDKVCQGRKGQEIHDNASRNLNTIMSRNFYKIMSKNLKNKKLQSRLHSLTPLFITSSDTFLVHGAKFEISKLLDVFFPTWSFGRTPSSSTICVGT